MGKCFDWRGKTEQVGEKFLKSFQTLERVSFLQVLGSPTHITTGILQRYKPGILTGVLQEFLNHAIPDYLVKDTDLFSLRIKFLKMTTGNTTAIRCE